MYLMDLDVSYLAIAYQTLLIINIELNINLSS